MNPFTGGTLSKNTILLQEAGSLQCEEIRTTPTETTSATISTSTPTQTTSNEIVTSPQSSKTTTIEATTEVVITAAQNIRHDINSSPMLLPKTFTVSHMVLWMIKQRLTIKIFYVLWHYLGGWHTKVYIYCIVIPDRQ